MIIMRKRLSNSRHRAASLMRYILREDGGGESGFFNSKFRDKRSFFSEVKALVYSAPTIDQAVTHFVISFPKEEEKIAAEKVQQIVLFFLNKMSYQEALSAFGSHMDSEHFHIHVAVVMADPLTLKSLNKNGIVREIVEASSEMCKEFNFSSPLTNYRMILLGIRKAFKSEDWDTIHETLESMSTQIDDNAEKDGYILRSGRWDTDLGSIIGFPAAKRYFDWMGPVPPRPKKPLPTKPNFWVMKKAAQSSLFKEKRKITEDFDKKLSIAEMRARCWQDEEKAWAEMEVEALWKGRVMAREILHFYSSVVRSITFKSWQERWQPIEGALWDWVYEKDRNEECLARLGVVPKKAEPEFALAKMV